MKKAIVTFGTGTHAELLSIARPSFQAFAKRHGYDYVEAKQIGHKRPAPWYKVRCLQDLLKTYDVAVFFGADLVIVDGRVDFPISNMDWDWGWYQAMVCHHTQCGDVPNDDMWICNKDMLPWLDKVWAHEEYMNHGWWEQAALLHVMGYDHLQVPEFPIQIADYGNELLKHTFFIPAEWNVHCWDNPQPQHQRIQHATMWPDRVAIMKQWAKQAEEWM